ncbi:MAG: pilus assembly protein PilM [Patescibacteria group bacterium]
MYLLNTLLPKRAHFGLSIGRTSLRGIELNIKGAVKTISEVPLPADLVDTQGVINKEVLTAATKQLLAAGKFTTSYVAVCFSEIYAYSREFLLPVVSKEEIHEAVSWHVKDLFPFPESEIYFDWKLLSQNEKEYQISVVAVQRKILDSMIEAFVAAGLKPIRFEPGTSAISRLLKTKSDESVLITEINRKGAYVSLVRSKEAIFTTVVNFAVTDTPESFLTNIGITVGEITSYFQSKGQIKQTISILLTGELATAEWAKALSAETHLTTQILNNEIVNPAFNKAYVAAMTPVAPPRDETSINLIPETVQMRYDGERTQLFYRALLTRTGLVVGMITFFCISAFVVIRFERNKLETQLKRLSQTLDSQNADTQQLLLLNAQAKNIVALAPLRKTPKDKLLAIMSLIPEEISISQWEYEDVKQQFMISGTSKQRSTLLLFKQKLEQSDEFAKITLPLGALESPENVRFTITFITKS